MNMDNIADIDSVDKDCSALGGLFQQIINDMKGSSPVWEDFMGKATKLHSAIKATIFATSAFLEAFQKIADLATNSRGATNEIGKAMTRLCIRHKSIENKLKSFNCLIVDGLVNPLQDKLEEWRKTVGNLDKDHAKEYKKARQEIKRSSTDTIRLQKKMKKGKCDMQGQLNSAMRDVSDKLLLLNETEKGAVRHAMIEERSHFCTFVSFLKPVVDEELSMLNEISHLQEIIDSLCNNARDPHLLPEANEQILTELKGSDTQWSFQTPPSSPSSLGSRKSSMCSISSINSSSSGSTKSHSPHHRHKQQPPPGTLRLSSISSQDSGFTSQDTLFLKPLTPPPLDYRRQMAPTDENESNSNASTPSSPYPTPSTPTSVWAEWPDPPCAPRTAESDRPHTISAAYEKTHARPMLTAQTFEPPRALDRPKTTPRSLYELPENAPADIPATPYRPHVATPNKPKVMHKPTDRPPVGPKPKAKPVRTPSVPDYNQMAPDQILPQPVYMNTAQLAQQAAEKHQQEALERQESSETENDLPTPTATSEGYFENALDLAAAVRELEANTAALYRLPAYEGTTYNNQQAPTSSELADAIRELEASTAALEECSLDSNSRTSQASFQSSSGYGTMNSTPSNSEDSVAMGDLDSYSTSEREHEVDKYSTIPRTGGASSHYSSTPVERRPSSITDVPVVHSGLATIRRHSSSKPPPPVRRSSSISVRVPPPKVPVRSNSITGNRSEYAMPQPGSRPRPASDMAGATMITNHNLDVNNAHGHRTCIPPQNTMNSTTAANSNVPLAEGQAPSNSRTNLINSLNAKFAVAGARKPPTPVKKTAPPVFNTNPSTPVSKDTLLSQIERGVNLKRTHCNDRSAPRIS